MIRSASCGTCPRPAEFSASRARTVHGAIRAASARSGRRRTTTNSRRFDTSECWSRSSASPGSIRRSSGLQPTSSRFRPTRETLRGIYGNQYATTYVGAILEVLIKAGYADDPRIAKALNWLLAMRQRDGGWAIPVRTIGVPFPEFIDVERHPKPLAPDKSKPSSHLVTGMVLRAFAAHSAWLKETEVRQAGALLADRLYKRDAYSDRRDVSYWERVSFPFWFTDIVSSLDTLSRLGFDPNTPTISTALTRLRELQRVDGTLAFKLFVKAGRKLDHSRRLKSGPPRRLRTDPQGLRGERPSSRWPSP